MPKGQEKATANKNFSKQLLMKWTDTLIPSTEDVVKRQFNKKNSIQNPKKMTAEKRKGLLL